MAKLDNRRSFVKKNIKSGLLLGFAGLTSCKPESKTPPARNTVRPLVVSTWNNQPANLAAWNVMSDNGSAVKAVEAGVKVVEADPNDMSVGYGGRPDRDGNVTLDACIMDSKGNYGAVTCIQHIKHPITVARMVMEETPHVMLTGQGALQFALSKGMKKTDLLTEKAKIEYNEWKKTSKYKPVANIELHDTIGMLTIDNQGDISGACTTSGMAYKMAGRVGDSPIIGSGLFVDNEIGAATATGVGELVLRSVGSFLIVELMRQGRTPQEACSEAVGRIVKKQDYQGQQVGYLAINKDGEIGAFSILDGFVYTRTANGQSAVNKVISYI